MGAMFDWIMDFIYDLAYVALAILPNSPFQNEKWLSGLDSFGIIMSNINYFVPFGTFLMIGAAYLTGVLIWYGVRWILRIANYIN